MPERFSVDVCYDTPCHWTPPPTVVSSSDQSVLNPLPEDHNPLDDPNRPIPGQHGAHRVHQNKKRDPEPQAVPPQHNEDTPRQGPPLQEWPNSDAVVKPIKPNVLDDIDPNV